MFAIFLFNYILLEIGYAALISFSNTQYMGATIEEFSILKLISWTNNPLIVL